MNDTSTADAPTLRERVTTWWAKANRKAIAGGVLLGVVLFAPALLATCSNEPGIEQAPTAETAVTEAEALAEVMDRLYVLDAHVARLQDRVAELEDQRPAASPRPRMSRAPAGVAPEPVSEPTAWSAPTDLDRAISAFNATLQEPTK
ncbi:hypothetical protein ACVC7V_21515 [Hydrogenophaga sp. A37]|uniref:hypothetical protein n=1 Tax=Hydrogenophaga sp. A37 TaxID=1945864 RepID=UPI0009879B1F|nr:hypothetical protein [Hydrogenophaga sp. A37]OOG84250.1 hypothetical protein B0E41_10905 [Hydrogenophaga sp. A37]